VLTTVAGLAQSLALADGLGVSPGELLELIAGGPLDMPYAHAKGAAMIERRYPVSFPVSGAAKDASLIAAAAAGAGVDNSFIDAARTLLETAIARGYRDDDMAAVYETVRAPVPPAGAGG
jgi:3-hydroxyisobutyrate dehydrogenase